MHYHKLTACNCQLVHISSPFRDCILLQFYGSWLQVVADLVPIFEATVSKPIRFQVLWLIVDLIVVVPTITVTAAIWCSILVAPSAQERWNAIFVLPKKQFNKPPLQRQSVIFKFLFLCRLNKRHNLWAWEMRVQQKYFVGFGDSPTTISVFSAFMII